MNMYFNVIKLSESYSGLPGGQSLTFFKTVASHPTLWRVTPLYGLRIVNGTAFLPKVYDGQIRINRDAYDKCKSYLSA